MKTAQLYLVDANTLIGNDDYAWLPWLKHPPDGIKWLRQDSILNLFAVTQFGVWWRISFEADRGIHHPSLTVNWLTMEPPWQFFLTRLNGPAKRVTPCGRIDWDQRPFPRQLKSTSHYFNRILVCLPPVGYSAYVRYATSVEGTVF